MTDRSNPGTDAQIRAWLRGSTDPPGENAPAPGADRLAEFVLDQPMGALGPIVRDAVRPADPPPRGAPQKAVFEGANRAVAVAFAQYRLGSPERPGWPGFGRHPSEQRALLEWAEVTATRSPGFAKHLLGVIDQPRHPAVVEHARIVVLAATGRVEEARHAAVALAHEWLSATGAGAHELPAADLEQLLARLPPDEELAVLRERIRRSPARARRRPGH